jgi:VanZ family protein
MQIAKRIVAVLWTAFIVYALTQEPSEIPRFKWLALDGMDKVIHTLIFLIEGWLISWNLQTKMRWKTILSVWLFCTILGGALELIQHLYIEGRSGDVVDLLADAFGAIVGVLAYRKLTK